MNNPINYRNKKPYKTAKYPIRQPIYLTWLIQFLSQMMLTGKKYELEKIGMEGIKPPYILLSNHMSFIDFELVSDLTYPQKVNNVVNIDGYYMRPWLMEWIGAICTRKFTNDIHLVRSIRKVLQRGDILCMYPEARYSPCGTTSYLPESLGYLVKSNKVPVVTVIHHGNYLHSPVWNVHKKRKVPLHTTMTLTLTADEAATLSVDEINTRIREAMTYNDYKYQLERGFSITEPWRAEGLHKILYRCPHCQTEFKMSTKGADLSCDACGKTWHMNEDSTLTATEGETEFTHIPDWFEWERACVREEIQNGTYSFEDTVDIHSMPRCYRFVPLGEGRLTHDPENGFVLTGHYRGQDFCIRRTPLQTNSLHVEYDFPHIKPFDCVDISTESDSFYCYPTKANVVTKLAFATEEIYKMKAPTARRMGRDRG